ncbi:TraI domain-containing protein [Bacillus sp. Brlt_9]|uniref:TraI domain-containing protein n=1 Tax=Bacillus sp. Brlt_9 TaxID=3110916 RepID=UPI003F7CA13C
MSIYKRYLFENGPFKRPEININDLNTTNFPITDWSIPALKFDIKQVNDNDQISDLCVGLDNAEVINNYLKLNVTNHLMGTVQAKIWSNKDLDFNVVIEQIKKQKTFNISGKWNEWPKKSGKFNIIIEQLEPIEIDPNEILPKITESRTELRNELLFYISKIDSEIQKLALDILKEVWELFIIQPAAMGHHHFQIGGLLQHTVEVMRVAYNLCIQTKQEQENTLKHIHKLTSSVLWAEKQNQRSEGLNTFSAFYEKETHLFKVMDSYLRCEDSADLNIVIFTILVHDIGKILEYTRFGDDPNKYKLWFPTLDIPMEDENISVSMDSRGGAKLGHITLGVMFTYKYLLSGKYSMNSTFWFSVMGGILSHHGRKDWGSPVEPSSANDWLIHLSDLVDSRYANEK